MAQFSSRGGPSMAALFNTTGKRIRMLRTGRGLSQLELSRELKKHGVDVNNTFISQIENAPLEGEAGGDDREKIKRPPLTLVVAAAKVLGTSTDFLLLVTDDPSPAEANTEAANA